MKTEEFQELVAELEKLTPHQRSLLVVAGCLNPRKSGGKHKFRLARS